MSELRFETWTMPGADVGPENPLPPLARGSRATGPDPARYPGFPEEMLANMAYGHVPNYLPYTLQDRYTRELRPRGFRVAVLENELLKATFLLELGGRLRSLVHKPTGRELFQANPVFQPANLAIRNAWFSGGVEWNIGMTGHCPFTCSPLFAARASTADNTPVLRLWEWERIRQVPFQLDAYLPDGSPMLLVRVRIVNPHAGDVPMYWWSNTAVPESADTRVLVSADSAYNFGYGEGGPALVAIPEVQGTDVTYTTRIDRAADFFFHVPLGQRPWVSALDGTGRGLVQVSTDLLKGRKLFLWGMNPGGRRWQEFLSVPGQAYLEIQSGLARTQAERLPMPGGAVWEWLEGYGLMEVDPKVGHGRDWARARQAVESRLEAMLPRARMDAELAGSAAWADRPPAEMVQQGSGWGALERRRRLKISGGKPFCGPATPFDDASLEPQQTPWLALLEQGAPTGVDPTIEPVGYLVQPEWRERLEQAADRSGANAWWTWLHLGVMRYWAEEYAGARQAWEASLAACPTPWANRNLAVLAREEGRMEEAAGLYVAACRQRPGLMPLVVECGQFLLDQNRPQEVLELLEVLPEPVRTAGRIKLLEGRAALAIRDFARIERLFTEKLVIDDLREGERSLSHLWFEFHEQRLSASEGVPVDEALKARVRREHPVPAHLDFRMSND